MLLLADPSHAASEAARARRAGAGDREAQSWLCRRVMPRVRKVARALARSSHDADDASQLALLEVLRAAAAFRGDASIDHWAGRIAARTVLRYLARERRKTDRVVEDVDTALVAPTMRSPMSDALPREIRAYLADLPDPQSESILLHHALGYSLDEVATLMQVSRNTVKSRLRLGTSTLRKLVRRERRIGAPMPHSSMTASVAA